MSYYSNTQDQEKPHVQSDLSPVISIASSHVAFHTYYLVLEQENIYTDSLKSCQFHKHKGNVIFIYVFIKCLSQRQNSINVYCRHIAYIL